MTYSRRDFLGHALSTAAFASLPLWLPMSGAWAASSEPIKGTPLSDDLTLFTGAGANVVAARGPEGLLLVDGGLEARSSALLKTVFKDMSARRVHTLINTHWHPEQTGSNLRLGKDGAVIIAHERTKLWLSRKIDVNWMDSSYGPLPEKARPTQTTYTDGKLAFGNEQIDYAYLQQAHTDGDLYVFFRKANVLVAGGALTSDRWPLIDWQTGGWMGGLVNALTKLDGVVDDATRIVPANGPILTRADLRKQTEMYKVIYDRLVKSLRSGLGPQEVLAAAPTSEFNPQWGDPAAFVDRSFRGLWPHFAPDA